MEVDPGRSWIFPFVFFKFFFLFVLKFYLFERLSKPCKKSTPTSALNKSVTRAQSLGDKNWNFPRQRQRTNHSPKQKCLMVCKLVKLWGRSKPCFGSVGQDIFADIFTSSLGNRKYHATAKLTDHKIYLQIWNLACDKFVRFPQWRNYFFLHSNLQLEGSKSWEPTLCSRYSR